MIDAPVTALAPWYGSKRAAAAQIVPHLGPHKVYWEPFCGSMAVLFAKDPARQETVNDLHGDLLNLARVVADRGLAQELDWQLRRTLVHEGLYREAVEALRQTPDAPGPDADPAAKVARARLYFVRSWMGMNGVAGTRTRVNFARRYTSNGGCPAVRFAAAVDSLPAWHERLRTVAVYQGCGIQLCEKVEDKAGTVIYADPPYLAKSESYVHDFDSADHRRLAAALNRFEKTRAVVSYYAHPDLAALYPGSKWRTVPLTISRALRNAGRHEKVAAPEILLVNDAADSLSPAGHGPTMQSSGRAV